MSPERTPTPEQQKVLESSARVRLVRAVPGSGKTWLIAEALRQSLSQWPPGGGGIAALSFTNVAKEEIRRALGSEPGFPHFVGTIDSFLFRYVVRPFAQKINPAWPTPRILPADRVSSVHKVPGRSKDLEVLIPGQTQTRSLFAFEFVREDHGTPVFAVPTYQGRHTVEGVSAGQILSQKRQLWKRTGRLSHSDAAYVAERVLGHGEQGARIVDLLNRRFPFLIVDELQDTGWYRSRSILRLLELENVKGLCVGDPDQAIFEFNGATPEVFDDFESLAGCESLSVDRSVRCPPVICNLAQHLSDSRRKILPREDMGPGRAILVETAPNEDVLLDWVKEVGKVSPRNSVKLVTRRNRDVDRLRGRRTPKDIPLHSRPLQSLVNAVRALRRGNASLALDEASSALSLPLLGTEVVDDHELTGLQIHRSDWRRATASLLLEAEQAADESTLYEWGCKFSERICQILTDQEWWGRVPAPTRPRKPRKGEAEKHRWTREDDLEDDVSTTPYSIQTVHSAKGETHRVTVLLLPKVKEPECPSSKWWAGDVASREERRVAFVAATRPTEIFVLCVPADCVTRLRKKRPAFFDSLEFLGEAGNLPVL